jgi:hypothetical protein
MIGGNMEELYELRTYIEQGRYPEALILLGEMEEMSYSDKVNKIGSFLLVLLLHLIKRRAEKRTTRSWEISIRNAVDEIIHTNRRRKTRGYFLTEEELKNAIAERYEQALRLASLEAFGGVYGPTELAEMVDQIEIEDEALGLILAVQH